MRQLAIAAAFLATASVPAFAGTHYLVRQWFQNGNQMCEYSNGSVLNVGGRACPTTIQG